MAESGAIIGLAEWLETPAGRYLLAWEQQHLDDAVVDLFGFHALQLGLPRLDALAANRMPHRWVATQEPRGEAQIARAGRLGAAPVADNKPSDRVPLALRCDFDALPFDSDSLDLVVLPHTLELSRDAHQTLREVERVLRPEGRVVIVGFNPASLWGLRRRLGGLRRPGSTASSAQPHETPVVFLPSTGDFLGYRRLRDWLRLLSFEVESGRFGCYRPPVVSEKWLARFGWVESIGDRWWPVFGALYALTAVKRVRGMRLIGLVRDQQRATAKTAPAVVARQHGQLQHDHEREAA